MKRLTALIPLLLAASSPAFVGCQAQDEELIDVAAVSAAHERYLLELEFAQEEFLKANPMPQKKNFGPEGTLYLHAVEIIGTPGKEQLFVRFSYLNETGLTIERARVILTLTDEDSGEQRSEFQDLRMPFGMSVHHNSTYTGFFDVPLEGIHRRANWSWVIDVEAEREAPPGSQVPALGPGAGRLGGRGRASDQ